MSNNSSKKESPTRSSRAEPRIYGMTACTPIQRRRIRSNFKKHCTTKEDKDEEEGGSATIKMQMKERKTSCWEKWGEGKF